MVRRIALFAGLFTVLTGFTAPQLPKQSRGLYRFDNVVASAARTRAGGVFALTVGFRREGFNRIANHRDRAQAILDRIERRLAGSALIGIEITVARLYPITREITLNVVVDDADRLDDTRDRLVELLSRIPGVSFAGEAGQVKVE